MGKIIFGLSFPQLHFILEIFAVFDLGLSILATVMSYSLYTSAEFLEFNSERIDQIRTEISDEVDLIEDFRCFYMFITLVNFVVSLIGAFLLFGIMNRFLKNRMQWIVALFFMSIAPCTIISSISAHFIPNQGLLQLFIIIVFSLFRVMFGLLLWDFIREAQVEARCKKVFSDILGKIMKRQSEKLAKVNIKMKSSISKPGSAIPVEKNGDESKC